MATFSPEGFSRESEQTQSQDRPNYSPTRYVRWCKRGLNRICVIFFCLPSSEFHTWHSHRSRVLALWSSLYNTSRRGVVLWITNLTGVFLRISPCLPRSGRFRGVEEYLRYRTRGESANPLRCNRRRRTRLHPNASPRGPSETLIAGRTFDCTSATRYANSPLFPDRVLKAWARHYAAVELVYGAP